LLIDVDICAPFYKKSVLLSIAPNFLR
jgi:hypothetical protein